MVNSIVAADGRRAYEKHSEGVYGTSDADNEIIKKVVLIGEPMAGKSALLKRHVDRLFSDVYEHHIGVGMIKVHCTVEDKYLRMMVWDIKGDTFLKSPELFAARVRDAEAVVLNYDCGRPFAEQMNAWANLDAALSNLSKPVVAFSANKADAGVREDFERLLKERAEAAGVKSFFTSAKTGEGVDEAFDYVAKELVKKYKAVEAEEKKAESRARFARFVDDGIL